MSNNPDLLRRLRGVYRTYVDPNVGPLNGCDFHESLFKVPLINHTIADFIVELEAGDVKDWGVVNAFVESILKPDDPFESGQLYVVPIRAEAARHIYELRVSMEK